MAHRFPKFRHTANEPIANDEINQNLRIMKDEIGRLNEHNISQNAFDVRTEAEPDYALQLNNDYVEYNPYLNFGDGTAVGSFPAETGAPYTDTRVSVDESAVWTTIMSYEKFTGNSLLWVLFSFQQQVYEASYQTNVGAQYAIRLNGTIIGETMTGGSDRANDPLGTATSCQAYPYVLDMVIPVPPGIHLIELVGRAQPEGFSFNIGDLWNQPDSDALTMIFNREVIILTLDPETEAVDGDTGTYNPLGEGEVINAAVISTPFDDVADSYNDIEYPGIQPRSLTGDHVLSPVIDAGYESTGTLVTHTYENMYLGFSDDTMGAVTGWSVIDDGTTPLSLTTAIAIDLTDTTIAGVLIGLDVHVIEVYETLFFPVESNIIYAIIAVQFQDENSDWHTVGKTERYVNSEYNDAIPTQLALRKNIGVRTLLTLDDLDGFTSIIGVRGVVSGFNRQKGASTPSFYITLQQASIWYTVMQSGS